ncbi:MAG: type-F conjugative transfer system secretin TraK [Candidatus Omnitrophica bacterium]|nr:type-F conjugative transfer system secretin TraK [Candidatus Omnitrophota bacterium]
MKIGNLFMMLFFLIGADASSFAATRVCGEAVVEIRSAVGKLTEIVVENGVADLVRSGDPSTVKVEHTAGHLFVTPLTTAPADLTVIDKRGLSHRLRHVFSSGLDEKIIIADCAGPASGQDHKDTVMEMIRDLVRHRTPAGSTQKVSDEVLFENDNWQMRSVMIYEAPPLWGYVAVVRNKKTVPLMFAVERITFPGLLAVTAEKDLLAPADETTVYMAVRR